MTTRSTIRSADSAKRFSKTISPASSVIWVRKNLSEHLKTGVRCRRILDVVTRKNCPYQLAGEREIWNSLELIGERFPRATKLEWEYVTIPWIVLSESPPDWIKNIPQICELAEKAAAQLKQRPPTALNPQDPTRPRLRILSAMITRGTSFEYVWNNIIAHTHAAAVKLGYRCEIERWREFVCDIHVLNTSNETEQRKA
jgi:hypothetical protein